MCAQILLGPVHDPTLYVHKDPEGIGSNEDTGLEQGYHNKLSSVYAFHAVLIK